MIKKKEDACILLFCYIPSIISLHYTPAYDIYLLSFACHYYTYYI